MSEDVVSRIYELRDELIIIGLTGRTGSGCSTTAEILSRQSFDKLDLPDIKTYDFRNKDERKYEVIYKYMQNCRWHPFNVIEVSSIILALILQSGIDKFLDFLNNLQFRYDETTAKVVISDFDKINSAVYSLKDMFEKAKAYTIDYNKSVPDDEAQITDQKTFYLKTIKEYKKRFKKTLSTFFCQINTRSIFDNNNTSKIDFYSYLFQTIGNNIRCSGNCYSTNFNKNTSTLPNIIDYLIRLIIKSDKLEHKKSGGSKAIRTRICIDALRNQYEIEYLRDRYKAFYCFAINVEDETRKSRLSQHLSECELCNLDKIEYPGKFSDTNQFIYHQNIQTCIESADIYIHNSTVTNGKFYALTAQLLKYIALILHPGIVTPTKVEYCMQLAYNASLNSGCLSRRVGSVITDDNFSIKAVGWNDVPEGKIPCNLRNVKDYLSNKDVESFSKFELENKDFIKTIKILDQNTRQKLDNSGILCAYCFKDVFNSIEHNKNQVHTRSLHAEENAFLQLSKYGGQGIRNGKLFVTASPCELCSKKSAQLGIKEIYYIDPYPGIAAPHILSFGSCNNPSLILFQGAIRNAFISLYAPKIPFKDEISLLLECNSFSKLCLLDNKSLAFGDITCPEVNIEMELLSEARMKIMYREKIINKTPNDISVIRKKFIWSGSGCEIHAKGEDVNIEILENGEYDINFAPPIKPNKTRDFTVELELTDAHGTLKPILSYFVRHLTNELSMKLIFDGSVQENGHYNVYKTVYADRERTMQIKKESIPSTGYLYELYEKKPNVNYTYALEWTKKVD